MKFDLGKVGITPGGNWSAGRSFEKLTAVLHRLADGGDGCGYVSLKDNINVRPGTDPNTWMKNSEAGQSIYELCVAHGTFVGTEEEFVAAYNAAVAAANAAAASAAAAEAQMEASEAQRVSAENARVLAEQSRVSAEQARVSAEQARVSAENARATAETLRENTFATQSAAMAAALALADTATSAANTAATAAATAAAAANTAATAASAYAERVAALEAYRTRISRDLGYNAEQTVVTMTAGETGKYVKCPTRQATANENFNISAPFDVEACSELLIKTGYNPSDQDHASLDISVISIFESIERTRTVQKKNDQNQPLYYVVVVDPETGQETVTTEETTEDTGYPVYITETYTENRYLPNNEDRFVAIPDSGYYVANIPQSCKCVVSYKPGVTDMDVIVVKHGALANLTSQLLGTYERRTISEALAAIAARIEALAASQGKIGNVTAGVIDALELRIYGIPHVLHGHGAPSSNTPPTNWPADQPWDGIPPTLDCIYINDDAASGGVYYPIGTTAVTDWKNA
ncbi:MAG: hypothetical protein K6G86_07810 [Bacteroidales bacterium]|nr:hypothetical protein [Bacteroidales bacterium]